MKKDKQKDSAKNSVKLEISADPVHGEPHDVFDMVNKYGTYNIQPTSDTHNSYPKIAQGLSKTADDESKRKDFGEK